MLRLNYFVELMLKTGRNLLNAIQATTGMQKALYRGSYMSAHVLLNLLNELGKRDKMRGLPSIFISFSQRV